MDLTGAFNGAAPAGPSQTESTAGTTSSETGVAKASENAITSASVAAGIASTEIAIDPGAQRLNDEQDRRIAQNARIFEENMRERNNLEDDLARRYGANSRQLRMEVNQLQNILDNSGPVRLAWLKLSRQISKDPHRDLNMLQSTLEMNEKWQADERRAFEARIKEQTEPRQSQAQQEETSQSQAQSLGASRTKPLTREQAATMLELLEDNLMKPAAELHHRPGGWTETLVHWNVSTQQQIEMSRLKAFVNDNHGPKYDLDDDPDQKPDVDFGPEFEPPY